MRKIMAATLVFAAFLSAAWPADAIARASGYVNPNYHYVHPYHRRNGTTVPGHYQTNPNRTKCDNYSTQGNINPWSGRPGTKRGC
jgi:hypothetical protein